eukprot:2676319-Rhodomonas_salina.1
MPSSGPRIAAPPSGRGGRRLPPLPAARLVSRHPLVSQPTAAAHPVGQLWQCVAAPLLYDLRVRDVLARDLRTCDVLAPHYVAHNGAYCKAARRASLLRKMSVFA